MLNLLPKRNPAVSLLYGKTGIQRIRVGKLSELIPYTTVQAKIAKWSKLTDLLLMRYTNTLAMISSCTTIMCQ